MRLTLIGLLSLLSSPAFAWEVDNVSCRFRDLKDALPALNKEVNARIAKAILEAPVNDPSKTEVSNNGDLVKPTTGCSREILRNLDSAMASSWLGNMETWAEKSEDVEKCQIGPPPPPNVYTKASKFSLGMVSLVGLGSSIRVGNVKMGVDKLSHFMTEGFEYFSRFEQMKGDTNLPIDKIPAETLRILHNQDQREETGMYGLATTGIYSYADTMADFQGFLFWKQILDGPNPYLKCQDGKWVQNRQFNWGDFLNQGFDESINCNRYSSPKMTNDVNSSIQEIVAKYGNKVSSTCPLEPGLCKELMQNYQPKVLVESLLSAPCLGKPQASTPTPTPNSANSPEAVK